MTDDEKKAKEAEEKRKKEEQDRIDKERDDNAMLIAVVMGFCSCG